MNQDLDKATAVFGDLKGVRVRQQPFTTMEMDGQVWTSSKKFFSHLAETYEEVEGMTYAIDDGIVRLPHIRRLLYTEGPITMAKRHCTFIKKVAGLHAKLYFGINDRKVCSAYIGSMNLIYSNSVDVMMKVPFRNLHRWFEAMWDSVR